MADKVQIADAISARRASCGYRIQLSCASCVNCERRGAESAPYHPYAYCTYNDFPVNLDRGLCEYFDHVGKYKS